MLPSSCGKPLWNGPAKTVFVHCDWAKASDLHQKQAGKGHHAIIRALAFKWIRILWRCWQRQEPYDEYATEALKRRSPLFAALNPTPVQG